MVYWNLHWQREIFVHDPLANTEWQSESAARDGGGKAFAVAVDRFISESARLPPLSHVQVVVLKVPQQLASTRPVSTGQTI